MRDSAQAQLFLMQKYGKWELLLRQLRESIEGNGNKLSKGLYIEIMSHLLCCGVVKKIPFLQLNHALTLHHPRLGSIVSGNASSIEIQKLPARWSLLVVLLVLSRKRYGLRNEEKENFKLIFEQFINKPFSHDQEEALRSCLFHKELPWYLALRFPSQALVQSLLRRSFYHTNYGLMQYLHKVRSDLTQSTNECLSLGKIIQDGTELSARKDNSKLNQAARAEVDHTKVSSHGSKNIWMASMKHLLHIIHHPRRLKSIDFHHGYNVCQSLRNWHMALHLTGLAKKVNVKISDRALTKLARTLNETQKWHLVLEVVHDRVAVNQTPVIRPLLVEVLRTCYTNFRWREAICFHNCAWYNGVDTHVHDLDLSTMMRILNRSLVKDRWWLSLELYALYERTVSSGFYPLSTLEYLRHLQLCPNQLWTQACAVTYHYLISLTTESRPGRTADVHRTIEKYFIKHVQAVGRRDIVRKYHKLKRHTSSL